jgi:hypothetical protein
LASAQLPSSLLKKMAHGDAAADVANRAASSSVTNAARCMLYCLVERYSQQLATRKPVAAATAAIHQSIQASLDSAC